MTEPERRAIFTRDEILAAVNEGANLVLGMRSIRDRDHDLVNLVANAALTVLDCPGADLDYVMDSNYAPDDYEYEPPSDLERYYGFPDPGPRPAHVIMRTEWFA